MQWKVVSRTRCVTTPNYWELLLSSVHPANAAHRSSLLVTLVQDAGAERWCETL